MVCSRQYSGSNSRDDLGNTAGKSLRDTMLEISRNAQQRGLTLEILQSILEEECPRFVFNTKVQLSGPRYRRSGAGERDE